MPVDVTFPPQVKFEIDALPGVKLIRDAKNQGEFTVEGNDIENVSRTCALISQSCAVRNKVCIISECLLQQPAWQTLNLCVLGHP